MAWWGVELEGEAHSHVRHNRQTRFATLGAGLPHSKGSMPARGTGVGTRRSRAVAPIGVANDTDAIGSVICCMHLLTATDKAGHAAGSARRRTRRRARAVSVSPDSFHAVSIRQWFAENGYPPLSEEQRRAVVLFGRVKPQGS